MTNRAPNRWTPVALIAVAPSRRLCFLIVALFQGSYVLAVGVRRGGDTRLYSHLGDLLLANGFDLGAAMAEMHTTYPSILYALFLSLVGLLKLLLGAHWQSGLVILNLMSTAAVAVMVVDVARRSTGSPAASWGALGLYLLCFGLVQWTPYALSDATFLAPSFAIFALAANRMLDGRGSWIPVFAVVLIAALYRPTGIVLLPAAIWALFLARSRPGAVRKAALALLAAAGVAAAGIFFWVLGDPSRWPFEILSRTIEGTARMYDAGSVVWGRPETYHAPPASTLDYAWIALDAFLHFFAIWVEAFSLRHALISALFFVPAYALIAWFTLHLVRGTDGLEPRQRDAFLASWAFLIITAVFHGMLQVDYDWRYRVPVLPHMVLLAAGGIAVLERHVRKRRRAGGTVDPPDVARRV